MKDFRLVSREKSSWQCSGLVDGRDIKLLMIGADSRATRWSGKGVMRCARGHKEVRNGECIYREGNQVC